MNIKNMEFVLASNNENKLREFREVFQGLGVHIFSLKDLNIKSSPEETGETFEENSLIKAREVAKFTNLPVIADDSGLEIHVLNNFPGIHSSRFMEGKPYVEKFKAIQQMLEGKMDRSANFTCALCVLNLEKKPLFFVGKAYGEILDKPHGNDGFGYDPIFYYPSYDKSFAEMSEDEKNAISHRGIALKYFVDYLKEKHL